MGVREDLAAYIRNGEDDEDKLRSLYHSCGEHGSFRAQWMATVQAIADANRPAAAPAEKSVPVVGDVYGPFDNSARWRRPTAADKQFVQYVYFDCGVCRTTLDGWHEWIAENDCVNITAKLREAAANA